MPKPKKPKNPPVVDAVIALAAFQAKHSPPPSAPSLRKFVKWIARREKLSAKERKLLERATKDFARDDGAFATALAMSMLCDAGIDERIALHGPPTRHRNGDVSVHFSIRIYKKEVRV